MDSTVCYGVANAIYTPTMSGAKLSYVVLLLGNWHTNLYPAKQGTCQLCYLWLNLLWARFLSFLACTDVSSCLSLASVDKTKVIETSYNWPRQTTQSWTVRYDHDTSRSRKSYCIDARVALVTPVKTLLVLVCRHIFYN